MQTTTAQQGTPPLNIRAIRTRLDRWELDHLRKHSADQDQRLETAQERIEVLEREVDNAQRCAEWWQEDAERLVQDLQAAGATVGLTQAGELVVVAQAGAAAPQQLPAIGQPWPTQGGTLAAIAVYPDGILRALVVADAAHEVTAAWGESGKDLPGTTSTIGATNTAAMLAAGSPVATQITACRAGGFDDWHIASRFEGRVLAEFAPKLFDQDAWYWTSTQHSRHGAFIQDFAYGSSSSYGKGGELRARPLRTIQLQPFSPSTLVAAGDSAAIFEGQGEGVAA